jgi:hypothetical protein
MSEERRAVMDIIIFWFHEESFTKHAHNTALHNHLLLLYKTHYFPSMIFTVLTRQYFLTFVFSFRAFLPEAFILLNDACSLLLERHSVLITPSLHCLVPSYKEYSPMAW